MLLAYADESGDSGYVNSPTDYFLLCVTMIKAEDWPRQLDRLVEMRRYMRKTWNLPATEELKATKILRPGGEFFRLGLSLDERRSIYRLAMNFQRQEGAYTVFAVCIEKNKITNRSHDPELGPGNLHSSESTTTRQSPAGW